MECMITYLVPYSNMARWYARVNFAQVFNQVHAMDSYWAPAIYLLKLYLLNKMLKAIKVAKSSSQVLQNTVAKVAHIKLNWPPNA